LSHYDIFMPEIWRKRVTDMLLAEAKITPITPVERYPFAESVHHFVETALAEGPQTWKLGTPFPISQVTYEKRRVDMTFYADGWEIPKPAVDRARKYGIGIDLIRREIDRKSAQAGLFVDKLISDAMVANAGNSFALGTAERWDDGWDYVKESLARAIMECRVDNVEPDTLIVSPEAFRWLIAKMPLAEAWGAEAIRTGKIPLIAGLKPLISNNLTTKDTAIVCKANNFGLILESYPFTQIGPKEYEEEMVWRAYFYFALGILINVPNAICTITTIYGA